MGPVEKDDHNYQNWLNESGVDDTPENRGWYDSKEEDRHQYIQDNPDWWKKF